MRKDVEFKTQDGVTLAAWHYLPDQSFGKVPTIVMAHGFSAVKEMYLDRFAEVFATTGLGALVFDNRNFGASGGEPRQEIDPWEQVRDYRDAITFAETLPETDVDRIGIWGSSYSGGHVLVVGAIDRRVPKEIKFKTKPQIALEQLRWACAAGIPRGVALMDAGYGADTDLRATITTLGLSYVAGIMPNTSVWAPGQAPLPAKTWSGQGRPPKLIRRDAKHRPISVRALARGLPPRAWRTIEWREGTAVRLSSRFARVRVRAAHRDYWLAEPRAEEWLLIEWPQGENEPTKYWLSTLPDDITFRRLVDIAKLRWRIERDYQELKQEVGLGHFEGRGWRGFHHHATLCIAAYGFLISERETIPPPSRPRCARPFPPPALPDGYRPRAPPLRPERHIPNSIATVCAGD